MCLRCVYIRMWARTCHVMWLTIHRQHSGISSLLPSWVLGLDSGNQVCVETFLNRLTGPQTLSFDPELQVFQAWILLIFTHEHCKTPVKNPSWRKSASILASSWALQMFFPPTWPGIWSKITELSGHQMVPQGHTETAGNSDRLARTADIEDSRKRASARDSSLSTRRQDSSLEVLAGTTK